MQKAQAPTGTRPEISNPDQGSQFTPEEWTGRLTELGIAISMDGKGRWMDNVFTERLWRSVKYSEIYLKEHAALGNLTPRAPYERSVAATLTEGGGAWNAA